MWTTRRATPLDRAALVGLCRSAVGPDDYVPPLLDAFLATGVVLLAEDSGRVIGMVVYHDVPDGSAWLHAARTLPEYRRQGVATALMSTCEALSRQRHCTAMRLWASANNVASVSANRKFGFRERARFTRMRVAASPGAAPSLEPLRVDARSWPHLRDSPVLRSSAGYLYHDFYFVRLDRVNASRLAGEGALWRIGDHGLSLSEDVSAERGKALQVQPLFGDLREILRAGPRLAAARGAERVETFLPHRGASLAAARAAGYRPMEWGQEAMLFEKPVPR